MHDLNDVQFFAAVVESSGILRSGAQSEPAEVECEPPRCQS